MSTILLFAFLTTALYYLGAWAKITTFLWSRYSPFFTEFTECAACSGTWYGFVVGLWGWYLDLPFLGLSPARIQAPTYALVVGMCAMVWTPILAWMQLRVLHDLAQAREKPEEQAGEIKAPLREIRRSWHVVLLATDGRFRAPAHPGHA